MSQVMQRWRRKRHPGIAASWSHGDPLLRSKLVISKSDRMNGFRSSINKLQNNMKNICHYINIFNDILMISLFNAFLGCLCLHTNQIYQSPFVAEPFQQVQIF